MLKGEWGRKKGKKERKDKERRVRLGVPACSARKTHLDVVVVLEEDLAQTRLAHGVVLTRGDRERKGNAQFE